VWMHGVRVAELIARGPGAVWCRYTAQARELAPDGVPLLSCALPVSSRMADAGVFAAGLLPDPEHRTTIARLLGVSPTDTFSLLERLGRDLPGAVVVAKEDPAKHPGTAEPFSGDSMAAAVAAFGTNPLGIGKDSSYSLPGRRDKLPLVEMPGGQWGRPVDGHVSTHLLKFEDPRFPGLAAAEAACQRIARELDLTWLDAELVTVGERPGLFMPRFDRTVTETGVGRLHAEDLCQALGKDPEASRGRGLYEASGGPSLRAVADLLAAHAEDPDRELARLVIATTFAVVIGNTEAHGRNVALLHPRPGVVALAPLYAVTPTTFWSTAGTDAAMSVDGRSALKSVTLDDLEAEGAAWGLGRRKVRREAWRTAERIRDLAGKAEARLGGMLAARAEAFLAG
jgi:serine/threonine-protein kinase HipA